MGCPDWPTCFGQWIPPTSESQLPADYQQIYADRGYKDTEFNVTKTWTEYLNRLLGVFTGFAILLTLIFSLPFRAHDKLVTQLAFAGFILVGVQGGLGARVVASNLNPGLITLHMLLAQIIVGIMIAAMVRSARAPLQLIDVNGLSKLIYPLLVVAMIFGLMQLVLGTQVRESVDLMAKQNNYMNRHLWVDDSSPTFATHKYAAIGLLLLNGWLIFQFLSKTRSVVLRRLNVFLAILLLGTTVMGMSMFKLNLPIYAQPLHLFMASLIFGTQLAILMVVRYARGNRQGKPLTELVT